MTSSPATPSWSWSPAGGDLAGGAELCSGIFVSRSRAGRSAYACYDGRPATLTEEAMTDLPYCSNGTVRTATLAETPVAGWYTDSTALADAFADVTSSTNVWMILAPPALTPDIDICLSGYVHLEPDVSGLDSVLFALAYDCGGDGQYCGVALDPRTGAVLDQD